MGIQVYTLIFLLASQGGINSTVPAETIDSSQGTIVEVQEPIKEAIEPVTDTPDHSTTDPTAIQKEITKFNSDGMVLKQGKLSTEVLRLNIYLKMLGYDVHETYEFNNKTRLAVEQYQKSRGLGIDGVVGKNTFHSLNLDMKQKGVIVGQVRINANQSKEMIIINKSSNTLYHMKNNDVIQQYHVATGKPNSPTPEGQFTIITKAVNPAWGGAGKYRPVRGGAPNNPLGKRWMGLNKGGGGLYGIHGNSDQDSIGTYASMGCIRMFNPAVESLYPLISKGTPVWIGFENTLKTYGVEFYVEND